MNGKLMRSVQTTIMHSHGGTSLRATNSDKEMIHTAQSFHGEESHQGPFDGLRRSETGILKRPTVESQQARPYQNGDKVNVKRQVLKQGYSVGPSARSQKYMEQMLGGEIPLEPSEKQLRGADIGNGYTLCYKELKSLGRLRKAGVDTD